MKQTYSLVLHDNYGTEYCIFYKLDGRAPKIKSILMKAWREIPQEQAIARMPDLIQRILDGWGDSQIVDKDYGTFTNDPGEI